jgi:hypothetical protein
MRKFLTVFFLALALIAKGQNDTTKYYTTADYGWKYNRALFRHALALPTDTTANKVERSIAYVNGNIYIKRASSWVGLTGGGGSVDTSSLSSRIDARVKYSDTALMLSPYLRSATAAATYQPIGNYLTGIDTTTISTRAYARKIGDSTFARVVAQSYVTTSGARSALSMTTTGTTGAATYNSSTGVINVPRYDQEQRTLSMFTGGGGLVGVSANSTVFYDPGTTTTNSTNEAARAIVVTRAGVLRNLYVRITTTQPATGSLVVTVRVNGANTSLVITIAAGSIPAVFSNLVNTVNVNAGDIISVQIQNNASASSGAIGAISLELTNN